MADNFLQEVKEGTRKGFLQRVKESGQKTSDIESQLREMALSESGFTQGQLSILIELLNQQIGAQQQAATSRIKQSTAGAPRAVQQSQLAALANQALGARQRGITQIQAGGIDRQMRALLALLQTQLQREGISAQKSSSLFGNIVDLGLAIGTLIPGPHQPVTGTLALAGPGGDR